jgi:hypothetical protein
MNSIRTKFGITEATSDTQAASSFLNASLGAIGWDTRDGLSADQKTAVNAMASQVAASGGNTERFNGWVQKISGEAAKPAPLARKPGTTILR